MCIRDRPQLMAIADHHQLKRPVHLKTYQLHPMQIPAIQIRGAHEHWARTISYGVVDFVHRQYCPRVKPTLVGEYCLSKTRTVTLTAFEHLAKPRWLILDPKIDYARASTILDIIWRRAFVVSQAADLRGLQHCSLDQPSELTATENGTYSLRIASDQDDYSECFLNFRWQGLLTLVEVTVVAA